MSVVTVSACAFEFISDEASRDRNVAWAASNGLDPNQIALEPFWILEVQGRQLFASMGFVLDDAGVPVRDGDRFVTRPVVVDVDSLPPACIQL